MRTTNTADPMPVTGPVGVSDPDPDPDPEVIAGAWHAKPRGPILFVNTKIRTRILIISRHISAAKLSRFAFWGLLSPEEV